jgi:uncharacterized protein (DUF885 family)
VQLQAAVCHTRAQRIRHARKTISPGVCHLRCVVDVMNQCIRNVRATPTATHRAIIVPVLSRDRAMSAARLRTRRGGTTAEPDR